MLVLNLDKKREPETSATWSGAGFPVRRGQIMQRQDHTSADSTRTQAVPWPSDSDRCIYPYPEEDQPEDDVEESFRIVIERILDPDDDDYSDDDGSTRP